MWWWLLACSDGTGGGAVPVDPSNVVDTAFSEVPGIAEALDCELPDERTEPRVAELGDLHPVVLEGLHCNDGTPARAYLRHALDPAHAYDVVVQLDGGAFCGDGPSCRIRWCGEQTYDARDMSSRWMPEYGTLQGLGSADLVSDFAGWNHVYIPYCSSDMWMGQGNVAVLDDDGVAYQLHFDGALIVDEVMDRLAAGMVSDDGEEAIPPMTDGTLLFAGASAGGMGVASHLDATALRFDEAHVVGLIDALWSPDPERVAAAGTVSDDYVERMRTERQRVYDVVRTVFDGRLDASCEAEAAEPWHCVEPGILEGEHVSTPFLLHHDLYDHRLGLVHTSEGADIQAYALGGQRDLMALAQRRPELGVLASACGRHTVLGNDEWFRAMGVPLDESYVSVQQAALAQLEGVPVVALDTVTAQATICPDE